MSNQRIDLDKAKKILSTDGTATAIAIELGISHQTVRIYKRLGCALAHQAHAELLSDSIPVYLMKTKIGFTPEEVCEIRSSSLSSSKLAALHQCSASMIRMIKTNKAYRN